jgi:hypothetical protein
MRHRPDDLDRALEHHGLAPGDVGRLFTAAAALLAAWQEAPSWEAWAAWSRGEAAAALFDELEEALETFAPPEGEA